MSDLDGKSYTVQYFERAVFELHPENQPPFNVLLSAARHLPAKEEISRMALRAVVGSHNHSRHPPQHLRHLRHLPTQRLRQAVRRPIANKM